MMAPYLVRLFCLCLAVFFLIHSVAGMAVALSGPAAIRAARRMRPRLAARFLLMLRLLPAALALFVVAGVCVPSYLWLEPEISAEEVGAGCLTAAILAAALCTISTARGVRAAVRSARHARSCERLGAFDPGRVVRAGLDSGFPRRPIRWWVSSARCGDFDSGDERVSGRTAGRRTAA
jgi:hypothetical protein